MTRLLKSVCIALTLALMGQAAYAETMVTSFYNPPRPDIAAHRTLPFGTILLLTNPRNGHRARVRIHDRGPFIRGRQLDVSSTVARRLGFTRAGVITLQVERISAPEYRMF